MNIGVFGGSFDPIHYGHLLLAEQCIESAQLDKVLFVPAAHSPLKDRSPVATDRQRLDMLQLAIADHPQFEISQIELKRGDISYTVDTLETLVQEFPNDQLFLMIGADSLADFPRWKSPQRITQLADLLITQRPVAGESTSPAIPWDTLKELATEDQIQQWQQNLVSTDAFDFSSTDIRNRRSRDRSIRYRTPRAVEIYLQTQNLYKPASS